MLWPACSKRWIASSTSSRPLRTFRLDSGEARTQAARFDLAQLAETTAEQMCLLAEDKHIDLVYETANRVEVEGDRARLKQVVVNLLDNAIKYTPEKGRVSLAVRAQNGSAVLEVADTGSGVSESALPHLFERFYRPTTSGPREVGGAGLGLSIVQSICTAHGGTVAAANTPPHGCRFTVNCHWLPRILLPLPYESACSHSSAANFASATSAPSASYAFRLHGTARTQENVPGFS